MDKKSQLKKLWFWWVNEDGGRSLRGTGKLEEIERVLFGDLCDECDGNGFHYSHCVKNE